MGLPSRRSEPSGRGSINSVAEPLAQTLPRAGQPGPPEGGATSSAHQMLAALSGGEGWPGAERTSPRMEEQGKDSRWREQCVKRPRSRSARFCSAGLERTGRHGREAPEEGGREHPQPGSPPSTSWACLPLNSLPGVVPGGPGPKNLPSNAGVRVRSRTGELRSTCWNEGSRSTAAKAQSSRKKKRRRNSLRGPHAVPRCFSRFLGRAGRVLRHPRYLLSRGRCSALGRILRACEKVRYWLLTPRHI